MGDYHSPQFLDRRTWHHVVSPLAGSILGYWRACMKPENNKWKKSNSVMKNREGINCLIHPFIKHHRNIHPFFHFICAQRNLERFLRISKYGDPSLTFISKTHCLWVATLINQLDFIHPQV